MKDEPNIDNEKSIVDYNVCEIENNRDSLAYGLHTLGREYINHFSSIKMAYKKLALTWLTAIFIALAFISGKQEIATNISKLYLISLVTVLAWFGVRLLRYLDINIYHKQLGALFKSLVEMEENLDFLRKSSINMAHALHRKYFDPVVIDSLYYGGLGFVIALLGASSIYLKLAPEHPGLGTAISFGIVGAIIAWECISAFLAIRHGSSRF